MSALVGCCFYIRVSLTLGGEDIVSLKSVSRVIGTEDLPLLALPLRLVDSINVVLDLHDNAAVLLDGAATAVKTLGRLDRKRACLHISTFSSQYLRIKLTILANAAVHLESLLIGVDINLDTRPRAEKRGNRTRFAPVEGTILVTVDGVAVVVAGAVVAAVTEEFGRSQVGANLLGSGPEVVDGVLLIWEDGAVRNEDVVNTDALTRVGHIQGVVQSQGSVGVLEAIQIPVGVRSQHDGCLLGSRKSDNLDIPGVGGHGIGDIADDLTGKALLAIRIHNGESDGRFSVCYHSEITPIYFC